MISNNAHLQKRERDAIAAFLFFISDNFIAQSKQRRVAEAELRNMYTMFICPMISTKLVHCGNYCSNDIQNSNNTNSSHCKTRNSKKGNSHEAYAQKQNTNLLLRLNDIMTVTNHELDNFGRHMRQYIVDDKGVRLDFPDPPFRTW